jgi:hypothetical protein
MPLQAMIASHPKDSALLQAPSDARGAANPTTLNAAKKNNVAASRTTASRGGPAPPADDEQGERDSESDERRLGDHGVGEERANDPA